VRFCRIAHRVLWCIWIGGALLFLAMLTMGDVWFVVATLAIGALACAFVAVRAGWFRRYAEVWREVADPTVPREQAEARIEEWASEPVMPVALESRPLRRHAAHVVAWTMDVVAILYMLVSFLALLALLLIGGPSDEESISPKSPGEWWHAVLGLGLFGLGVLIHQVAHGRAGLPRSLKSKR
jgi:hypothetical protein